MKEKSKKSSVSTHSGNKRFQPFIGQKSSEDSEEEIKSNRVSEQYNNVRERSRSNTRSQNNIKKAGLEKPNRGISTNKEEIPHKSYKIPEENSEESDEVNQPEYSSIAGSITGRNLSKNEMMFFDELQKALADETLYLNNGKQYESLFDVVMKAFTIYVDGIFGADELFMLLENSFRHIDEFEQFKSFCLSRECNRRKETWFCRNLDDTNMKECTRIDQSYKIVPEDYPESIYTGKTDDFYRNVLNDRVVSVPQGSESSFTFKAKNKHEEGLFKIEDERYELDQAINLNYDVIKVLENANKQINDNNGEYVLDRSQFTNARVSWIFQVKI